MAAGFPEFLQAWVATQPDLLSLLGGVNALRVSPWQAVRSDGAPRITFFQVSGITVTNLAGATGTFRQRWSLGCWGIDFVQARLLVGYLLGDPDNGDFRLNGYLGTLAGVKIKSCLEDGTQDLSEPLGPGSDMGNPCLSVDFKVAFSIVA